MQQVIPFEVFWARYGKRKFQEDDFFKAISCLPSAKESGPWIAGGSVRRLVSGMAQDSDFDFFFRDQAQLDEFNADMISRGAKVANSNEFNISYRLYSAAGLPTLKVQAIRIRFFPTLEAAIDSFDFSLCQCGYDGTLLHFGMWTLWDLANKRLVPGKITYGVSSVRRVIKYTKQGYTICGGGLTEMLQQIADAPEIIQGKVEYID